MTTQTADEKARRREERLRKRREALVQEMKKDLLQLKQIIQGQPPSRPTADGR